MPAGMSKTQVNKLGKRLRDNDPIPGDDLELLQRVRQAHADALDGVARVLREELRLEPTSRLKTVGTLVEKLRRQHTMPLSSMQDIAGVRVVIDGDRRAQDEVVLQVAALFPDAPAPTDRRDNPSSGYRAVHLVVSVGDCLVEVQIRTLFQDAWAQLVERLGDAWGRGIRYGQDPEEPEHPVGGSTRREAWELVRELSEIIDVFEQLQTSFDTGSMREAFRQRLIDEGRDEASSRELLENAENEIANEWNLSVDRARSRLMSLLSNTARSLDVG